MKNYTQIYRWMLSEKNSRIVCHSMSCCNLLLTYWAEVFLWNPLFYTLKVITVFTI